MEGLGGSDVVHDLVRDLVRIFVGALQSEKINNCLQPSGTSKLCTCTNEVAASFSLQKIRMSQWVILLFLLSEIGGLDTFSSSLSR
jgi:hypothetical protein